MKLLRFSLILFSILFAALAWAQTGTVSGKVTDEEGAAIGGATVELTGTALKTTANQAGEYTITDVPAGTYTVRASTYSYRAKTAQVTVSAGQTVTQDFALRLDLLAMERVVVTGTTTPEKKIESSTTITTLDNSEIEQAAPRSTTEYLRRVPGFTRVESSGGEVNQNISVRGLLGVEVVNIQEDGMPVYPTSHVFFMNADNLIRPDENIDTVEVVRGSDSPIFASSAAAAIVNFINKTGGDELHGTVKGSAGQGGLGRFDFNTNGPLSSDWRFNFGGFYRYDHGIRDPGYPGTRGGQVKGNVTRLLSNGFFRLSGKYIDDRNLFILPLPHINPDDPKFVSGFSNTGAYSTIEGVDISVPLPTGERLELPLDDGIYTRGGWVTGEYNFSFGENWQFDDTAQAMSVNHQWNAIAPGSPQVATLYAQGVLSDFISKGLVPPGSTYQLLQTNHLDANGNKLPFDTPNGLVEAGSQFHVLKPISSFQNNLLLRKPWGNNDIAFGSYFAYYTQENHWYFPNILTDVEDNPKFLDLVIVQPNGQKLDVTKNGFRNFLSFYVNAHGNNTLFSTFGSDKIKITDRFRLDLGLRYERQDYTIAAENTDVPTGPGQFTSFTVDLDGDPRTVYDIENFGNQTFRHFKFNKDNVAFSVGSNYQLQPDRLALYGSFTRGFWMPALDEFIFDHFQGQAESFEPRKTSMWEGGVKYSSPHIGFTATGYYAKLYNIFSRGVEFLNGQPVFVITANPDTTGWGIEYEVLTRPAPDVELRSAGTFIDIGAPAGAQTQLRSNGFTPAVIDFEAAYLLYGNARLSADWHYVGVRYRDPQLTVKVPAYSYVNLGASYKWTGSGITAGVSVLNLTNSEGIEEGDPRADRTGASANLFNARPILPRRFLADVRYDW